MIAPEEKLADSGSEVFDPRDGGRRGSRASKGVLQRLQRVSTLAEELGDVNEACRRLDVPRPLYESWLDERNRAREEIEQASPYDYARFSRLSGQLTSPLGDYKVAYRPLLSKGQRRRVFPLVGANLVLATIFFVWLIQPGHYPNSLHQWHLDLANAVMFGGVALIESLRLLSSFILSWSAWRAKDPIPVTPPKGLRVAFTTTIVPSKEPLAMVERTLRAALEIKYERLDVWLLDEGDDPEVKAMCQRLGVHHFSRKGVEKWNQPSGPNKAKTKHGNHNAWLDAHGDEYDIEISVDPDHVPLPNMAERLLGYFRDPDVAFVVGPQVYGNYQGFLTKAAESQAYLFQSVIQRAANRHECGMFVGTNHAYRISAWQEMGGFEDSITEDIATSLKVHGSRNPVTGRRWKSVYTPDVVSVGEGPATWTDYFTQQMRWSRGADEMVVTGLWRRLKPLSWGRRMHYLLILAYYPSVAIAWMLGMTLTALYVLLGASGIAIHIPAWAAMYGDLILVQLSLYFWLRRLNVSPHEEDGTTGIHGMIISVLSTPIYVTALVGAVLRRKLAFVVTPKGQSVSADTIWTFRRHLQWGLFGAFSATLAVVLHRQQTASLAWAVLSLVVCLTPILLWLRTRVRARVRRAPADAPWAPPSLQPSSESLS
jgi:cellulose synthase/poly-beta-1,6-N-acetylglucosamine synthase-like glycosyltransferase